MKLISMSHLATGIKTILQRFPLKVLLTIIATIAAVWLSDNPGQKEWPGENLLIKVLSFCNLAFVFSLATDLFCESRRFSAAVKWLVKLTAVALCLVIVYLLEPAYRNTDIFKLVFFAFAFHLMVSFAAFWGKGSLEDFWYFNKTLFLRLLTGALYSAVLVAGLFLALAAIDNLFEIHVDNDFYLKIFLCVVVGFNTIFFLAGVPQVAAHNTIAYDYPKGLKIFTQYVLLPLITLYFIILIVYELKIMIQGTLPKGYVSTMVLAYASVGILSLLLIYPIRNDAGNKWINWFSRLFYILLIPLLILFVMAIRVRVKDYGITEERYVLMVLAAWISGITIYFLVCKKDNIKLIPISLAAVALLSAVGPQSATNVSRTSQVQRLKQYYPVKNKKGEEEALSIVKYLVDNHGLQAIQPFTQKDLGTITAVIKQKDFGYILKSDERDTALALLNIKKNTDEQTLSFYKEDGAVVDTRGYAYAIFMQQYDPEKKLRIGADSIIIKKESDFSYTLEIQGKGALRLDVDTLVNNLNKDYANVHLTDRRVSLPESRLSIKVENDFIAAKLVIIQAIKWDTENTSERSLEGCLLLQPK